MATRPKPALYESDAEYYALSYTWGAPTEHGPLSTPSDGPNCPILCNGKLLHITANLQCVLFRIRQLPGLVDKKLWIDAICVNQQDERERSDQVRLMANIYSTAAVVVSWLGEQDQHTEPAFALLGKLRAVSDHSPYLLDRLSKLSPDSHDYGDDEQMAAFSCRQSWVSVAHVFQRTYFTRVWIIQEVVLAKTVKVLCGGHELDWSVIAEASHFFSTSSWAQHLTSLFNRRKQQGYQHENRCVWARTLLHTLIRARNFKATDPRDKVYALLGLVHEYAQDKSGLIPAYELADAQPLAAAFTRSAIQILEDGGGDLLLLSCVEGEKYQQAATGRLPSWVPDWSSEEPTGLRVTGYERYAASGGLKQTPAIDRETLSLRLSGVRLDRVTMVGESKRAALRGEPFPKWLEIVESLETFYYGGKGAEHKLDVFWRTIIGNTAGYPPRLVSKSRSLGASFAKWFRETTSRAADHAREDREGSSAWHALVNRFQELLDARWDARSCDAVSASEYATPFSLSQHLRLFRTAKGYLGIGSECAQTGDWVWIVPGSRVPLLLRSLPLEPEQVHHPRRNRHRLVGGAYLHGFMEGEAVSPSATGSTMEGIRGLVEPFTLE
ncbi:heterokaryon incompatibility protein-domain-containing protein [Parachaetomium inaequale]|uniref:Heterokaryon incompatibility protein-domain-containing protein n=1 Tax=Parachaetomium inaequale TaxID=2588326 RepID=A0AAN6PJS1_9PEZI|nr:heterokaryon incompatibility protein-domain-containing protein [Parachaetomium inaequale]